MAINFTYLNGKSPLVNWEIFEKTALEVIGRNCRNAKIFVFNKFPVPVSFEFDFDVLLIIAVEDVDNNYYYIKREESRAIYFHNQIIPIKFITHLKEGVLLEASGNFCHNGKVLDYSQRFDSIKFGLKKYLVKRCQFNEIDLFINPLIFIKNSYSVSTKMGFSSSEFDFYGLHRYFCKLKNPIFISYKTWRQSLGFSIIEEELKRLMEVAAKDSETGYLTKKKIENIFGRSRISDLFIQDIPQRPVMLMGKAGTGKTSELLSVIMDLNSQGKKTVLLTYNWLLVYDLGKLLKASRNYPSGEISPAYSEVCAINTLHSFYYRLSYSLGVLHILTNLKLASIGQIEVRVNVIVRYLEDEISKGITDLSSIKSNIQNDINLEISIKEVGVEVISHLIRSGYKLGENTSRFIYSYLERKEKILRESDMRDFFLKNYYSIIRELNNLIRHPELFYQFYKSRINYENLKYVYGLLNARNGWDNKQGQIPLSEFLWVVNLIVGVAGHDKYLFIDEAQDCHAFEKEVVLHVFDNAKIIVSNGGKEQLVRHVEMCNWNRKAGRELSWTEIRKKPVSFRVKKAILDLCNFLAVKFKIALDLKELVSDDVGEVIIDFNKQLDNDKISSLIDSLHSKGRINDCTPYESVMLLLDGGVIREENRDGNLSEPASEHMFDTYRINEYENIEEAVRSVDQSWSYLNQRDGKDLSFWNGLRADKRELLPPMAGEFRVLYYESCRGLEAWSVACFGLDSFFTSKRNDPEADKYFIDDKERKTLMQDMFQMSEQDRKRMYAANWVIMALTRAMDTAYINIRDENSELGRAIKEYISLGGKNVRIMN